MESNKAMIQKQFNTIAITKQYNNSIKDSNCLFDCIENQFQLKSHLAKNNYTNPKTLFLFIISSFHAFTKKNYGLLYQILSSFISKIEAHASSISYDTISIYQYTKYIYQEYDCYINLINKKFGNLLIQSSFHYLSTHSKHSMIILLLSLMISFTYIIFDIDKTKTSKRETYHLLKSIKQKHLCQDMDRIMCPVCSINCITLIRDYLSLFMTKSYYKSKSVKTGDDEIKNDNWKLNNNYSNSNSKSTIDDDMNERVFHIVLLMESINTEIINLEKLIKNDRLDVDEIKEKIKQIDIKR